MAKPLVSELFSRESEIRVLRFLWQSRTDWSGREIARKVGLSPPACHDALKRLYARGLVHFRRVSHVHLYKINPESYLVERVFAPLFQAEGEIEEEVTRLTKETLVTPATRRSILSIILFGSRARGEEKAGSDLDLLVVVVDGKGAKAVEPFVEKLRSALFKKFNIPLSPYVQTLAEIRKKRGRKLPLTDSILQEGKLVYGREFEELVS
ncbi:MAG: winged helix-turn-helix domain-containing protein [Elusimicrobiota bacterium]